MPPPRLPRHLRPCHPPGTAHHGLSASRTARINLSTAPGPPTAPAPTPSKNSTQTATERGAQATHGEHVQEEQGTGEILGRPRHTIRRHVARRRPEDMKPIAHMKRDRARATAETPREQHGRDMSQEKSVMDMQRQLQQLLKQAAMLQATLEAKLMRTEPSAAGVQQDNSLLRRVYRGGLKTASEMTGLRTDSQPLKMKTYDDMREDDDVKKGSLNDNDKADKMTLERKNGDQRLARQIHTHSRSMSSSDHINVNTPATRTPSKLASDAQDVSNEVSEQSLFEELFPEANSPPPSHNSEKRDQYPKLDLPNPGPPVRGEFVESPKSRREQMIESFQKKREETTLLQLAHCSTELTEADFRRLIPKGKHIDTWRRDGEFYNIIPGRDPLSLERMPFYYILFRDPESALAYQKNASRLHKLSALHQPSNIFSAIPPPKGFLEDGEDLNKATSLYNLLPTRHHLSLYTIMQPYNPALRSLIERGGYQPIMPNVDSDGKRIWKVLMHIEGYEPTPSDLFKIFLRDAYKRGMPLTLRKESSTSVHRLRDIINLKTRVQPVSSVRPSAYGSYDHDTEQQRANVDFEDPAIQLLMAGTEDGRTAKEVNQMVMNRVYNRWVIEFSEEESATRFALSWHRRVLPDLVREKVGWKDVEEVRLCNTEVLW